MEALMPYAAVKLAETPATSEFRLRDSLRHILPDSPLRILLVEDDFSDIMLTEIALDATHVDYELHTLGNGADVIPYLRGQRKYQGEPNPDILMLDLSLPSKDGFEILAELSINAERYRNLPIIILTGDTHCAFLKTSYDLNIAEYLTKPCTSEKIERAIIAINKHKK